MDGHTPPGQDAPFPDALDLADADADLDHAVARVADGEEVVILREGQPVARLVPPWPVIRFGLWRDMAPVDDEAFAPMTDDELDEAFGPGTFG